MEGMVGVMKESKDTVLPGINRPLYRYWNGHDHFYTTNPHEIGTITRGRKGRGGYTSEGVACYVAY